MKLLHTADWHLGKRLGNYSRLSEQQQVLEEICRIADREDVDAVLIAGDLFDTFNPSNEASELFYRTVHRLSAQGTRAVIAIAGNHDSPDRIEAPDTLARECGIVFVGYPGTTVPISDSEQSIRVLRAEPGFAELKLPRCDEPLRLLLTPYANEVTLKRCLSDEATEERALREVLRHDWQQRADHYCDEQGVNVLMAHLYFMRRDGPRPDEPDDEKPILHMGGAPPVFTEDIPAQMQYVALGHLHRYHILTKQPCPVCYSSSPLAYSFNEIHQEKQVVVVSLKPGQAAQYSPVALQAGRTLCRKRFEAVDEALAWLQANPYTFVELTIISDTYLNSQIKKALYAAHDGIVSIIPELSGVNTGMDDSPDIDLSQDLRTLFADYFQQKKGQAPGEDLLRLFDEVIGQ